MVKKDVLDQMLIDNQIEIGDIVKVGYKGGYNSFSIVISVNPLKIFSGVNNTTERISCVDLETITKSFKPTMSEFYRLAEGEYSIFVNLYERFPFDLNYVGPLINEKGEDDRQEYNPDWDPSFLSCAIGYGLGTWDFNQLALYILEKGAVPTKRGYEHLLGFLMDRGNEVERIHRSADDVIAKYIEKGMDAFQTMIIKIKGTKYSVYPIWEHFRKHPAFRPKLLAIPEVQNDARKESFVLEYSN